jgi:hypothetical protein
VVLFVSGGGVLPVVPDDGGGGVLPVVPDDGGGGDCAVW